MEMRDRLIELLRQIDFDFSEECVACLEDGYKCTPDLAEFFCDHLLENGVIVPPCKVGDVVYDICTIFDESTLKPKTVIKPRIIDFVSKVGFIIESKGLVIGEKDFGNTVFLTKEEAEAKLKEREGNG